MGCLTTASVLACLLSPSNLTIESTLSRQVAGDFHYNHVDYDPILSRTALQMNSEFTHGFSLIWGVEHISMLNADDRGQERAYIGFVFRPFK